MWSRQLLARTRSRGLSTLAGSRPTCTALATASSSVCWVPRRLANTAPRTQESDCEQDVTFSEDTATANLLSDLAPSEVNIEQEQLPPFEGPEKLLELWFSSDHAGVNSSLRDIPADVWQKCLDEVQCTILSTIQNEHVTAYLLSESSMFVYADKVLIKTCGTTTLLKCLPGMIELAKTRGLNVLEDVFYSRQSFNFPDRQLYPHKSVDQEVDYLSREFKQGAAYCLGRLNESNYNFFNAETATPRKEADSSLEVMMTGLDDELMQKHFFKDTFCDKTTFKASGIGGLFENAIVDEYAFEPCGYSMNGIVDDAVYTIHITPEPGHSYASFECNVKMPDYTELLEKVLNIFNPEKFLVVSSHNKHAAGEARTGVDGQQGLPGYLLQDQAAYTFEHYQLNYMYFQTQSTKEANKAALPER